MKKISFSVLMSVYVKEKKENLEKAIESIVNQNLQPNEVIIVEDGILTKELDDCIEKYKEKYKYIKIIKLDHNVGLGKALNEGLKYCNYEYVARMDSDDIALPDRFEKQINYLNNHDDVDVLGGYIMEFDDITKENISKKEVPLKNPEILKYLKKRNPMNHMTVIFKKSKVIDSGGYKDCLYFEDYYLWVRMIKNNCKLENMDHTLVMARAGLSMVNRRGNLKYIKCIINFETKMYELKVINLRELIVNILIRSCVALIPNKMRYKLYQKKLRKNGG